MFDRRFIAFHEAGHAVRGFHLGRRFSRVSAIKTEGQPPSAFFDSDAPPEGMQEAQWLEIRLATVLAGFAAESILDPSRNDEIRPGDSDGIWALHFVRQLSGEDQDRGWQIMRRCYFETKQALSDDWAAVKAIADLLMECDSLDYDQCVNAISAAREGGKR